MNKSDMKWYDRKRIWCGLPWTFTKYGMTDDRLFVEKGLFSTTESEVRLYRVMNVNLKRTLMQKLFGLGTIHIDSSDRDLGCFDIINIKNSYEVKEMLSQAVEAERIRNRVTAREYMTDGTGHEDDLIEPEGAYDPDDEYGQEN